MIPNVWRGFDFALGEDVDALRDTVGRFTDVPVFMWYEREPTERGAGTG